VPASPRKVVGQRGLSDGAEKKGRINNRAKFKNIADGYCHSFAAALCN